MGKDMNYEYLVFTVGKYFDYLCYDCEKERGYLFLTKGKGKDMDYTFYITYSRGRLLPLFCLYESVIHD
jgi:hypothetical protein